MINYEYNDLFSSSADKQLNITFDDGTVVTNKDLHQGSFELHESLCSESRLTFGCCEAAAIKFKISNVFNSLLGQRFSAKVALDGHTDNPFSFGKYKVYSDVPTADKRYRDVTGYDAMYEIVNADVAKWYNSLTFPMTLREFRKAFVLHFGLGEVETSLVNDEMVVEKTIEAEEISGKDVITAICEINGCFGNIDRQGRFRYVVLKEIAEGLYPSNTLYPSNNLYPETPNAAENFKKQKYTACHYEDFNTEKITQVIMRQEEADVGASVGDEGNSYIIEGNFLLYGKTAEELATIGQNFLNAVKGVYYRPIKSLKSSGKPYLEVGDGIIISSKTDVLKTYILERTLKGIQAVRDTFKANGEQIYQENLNSLERSIKQLQGMTNKLTRTNAETRSNLENLSKKTASQFLQTAEEIALEVERAERAEAELTIRADNIELEVEGKLGENEVRSLISVELEGVIIKGSQIQLEGATTINNDFSVSESGVVTIGDFIIKDGGLYNQNGTQIYYNSIETSVLSANSLYLGATSTGNSMIALSTDCNVVGGALIISEADVTRLYVDYINGSTPITSSDVDSIVAEHVEDLNSSITSLENNLSSLSDDVDTNSNEINLIYSDLTNAENNISALDTRVTAIENQLSDGDYDYRITELEDGINYISSDVKTNSEEINLIYRDLDSLEARISALEK